MNKRARNRLVGITAIIVIAVVAIFATMSSRNVTAYNMTVDEAAKPGNVGKRIKVGGVVVTGSWDKKSNPMTFKIRDEDANSTSGEELTVIYSGAVPSTFGDGVTAIVTGEMDGTKTIQAGEMITKCPSKYESATGAYQVVQLKKSLDTMINVPVKVGGVVKAGSILPPGGAVRFVILNEAGSTEELSVAYEGALPDGMADGSKVVLTGEIDETSAFKATNVAIEK